MKDEGILCGILDKHNHNNLVFEIVPYSVNNSPISGVNGTIKKFTLRCGDCNQVIVEQEWNEKEEVENPEFDLGSFIGVFDLELTHYLHTFILKHGEELRGRDYK